MSSYAAMKRKLALKTSTDSDKFVPYPTTRDMYNKMHKHSNGGDQGFSLNGTHRNHTYVGQTNSSRTTPLPQNNVLCVCKDYNATVVIPSVVGSSGMLATKYRWIRRGYPFTSVKPDHTNHLNRASDYTENLAKRTLKCVVSDATRATPTCSAYDPEIPRLAKTKTSYYNTACPNLLNYNKVAHKTVDQGEYIKRINNKCVENDVLQHEVSVCRTPVGLC